jgi:hypothetical protein
VKLNQLDASQGPMVPVINEFPDAFPEELLDMPPDRDIEFVIDLKPHTASIYKSPNRMATLQLAELKEHSKEKGHIRPSSSLSGAPAIFVPKKDGTCLTRFCKQNQVLIACVPRIIYSTHTDIKCSRITKSRE